MYKKTNKSRKTNAVSEVFSVILMLTVSVSVFMTISYLMLDDPGPMPESSTILYGKLKDDILSIEPLRGSELSLDTICILNIGGIKSSFKASDLLDTKSNQDGVWNIGERAVCQLGNFTYFRVSFQVINQQRNLVLWDELIQDGITSSFPYIVLTLNPTNIKDGSAELWLGYNFGDKSGSIRFSYKELGGSWINTAWEPKSSFGTYNKTISGLSQNKIYIYRAELTCESNTINGEEIPILQNGLTSVDTIIPYIASSSPINVTATGPSELEKVTLYYRWSEDNSTWDCGLGEVNPITIDSTSSSQSSLVSSITWSHVVGNYNNRILVVCSGVEEDLLDYAITDVDYNGKSLTKAYSKVVTSGGGYSASSEIWYLLNPDIGNYNIRIFYTGQINECSVGAASFYNVLQQAPEAFNSNSNEGLNEISTDITTLSDGAIVIDVATCGNGVTFSQGSGQIKFFEETAASSGAVGSYKILPTSGYAKFWENVSSGNRLSHVVVAFAPTVNLLDNCTNWTEWETSINPDFFYPWSWNFKFPNDQGYYQFYSIGTYNEYEENSPKDPDAFCLYDAPRVIDSFEYTFEFDSEKGKYPSFIHISGDIYAISYTGDGDDGILKTVEIFPDGNITKSVIDSFEFDSDKGKYSSIIHISGNIYAIVYSGDSDNGFVKTIRINPDGDINPSIIDTLEFDIEKGLYPSIIQVSGNVYAIVYTGDGDNGFVRTVEIDNSGNILDSVLDSFEFDTDKGKYPSVVHVSGDIYAIAYSGDGDNGFVKTLNIAIDGFITPSVIDTLEFDTEKGKYPTIIHVSGDIYGIVYSGDGDNGFVRTVEIDNSGNILDSVLDSFEFDTDKCMYPSIVQVSGDVYAIAYGGDGDDGFVLTINIASNGIITKHVIDTFEFDPVKTLNPKIIQVSWDIYAIAYCGDGDDGFVKTVEINFSGDIR